LLSAVVPVYGWPPGVLVLDNLAGQTSTTGPALLAPKLALYQRHTGRMAPPSAPAREATLICGRRAGKSRVLALVATYLAAFRDYTPQPGSVADWDDRTG
jgi:hypothetical protein